MQRQSWSEAGDGVLLSTPGLSVGRTFRPELLYYLLQLPRRLELTPGTSHVFFLRILDNTLGIRLPGGVSPMELGGPEQECWAPPQYYFVTKYFPYPL